MSDRGSVSAVRTRARAAARRLVRAYRRGGPAELVRSGRRQVARLVWPGTLRTVSPRAAAAPKPAPPKPAPPKPKPAPPAPPVHQATSVSYADALAWFERRRPNYERLIGAVAPYVDPDGLVLDVGANIGYFSQTLCEQARFRGTVHLFEPLPHLAELCRVTAERLPCTAVVHEVGLSDAAADVELYVAAQGNLGWNTMVKGRTSADMVPVTVAVDTFDGVGVEGTPCLVKIDVEGAEWRVFGGMLAALERWSPRPAILCEIGWGTQHPDWDAELAAFDRLAGLGYTAHDLAGAPVDVTTISHTTDVLFLPEHLTQGRPSQAPDTVPAVADLRTSEPAVPSA